MMVGIAALFAVSSCLQNVEPSSVENLRNAKSELIKAEAQYKIAEIALVEAEAALQAAIIEGKNLENEYQKIENDIASLYKDYYADSLEYERQILDLKLAEETAANEEEIARLKASVAYYEVQMMQYENEKMQKEYNKEVLAEKHKEALIDAQKAVAEAEKEYQAVLDEINLAAENISDEEKALLKQYTNKIENIRTNLNTAQETLVEAQQNLIDAKYAYDEVGREIELTRTVAANTKSLEDVQALLEEAKTIDLTAGQSSLIEKNNELKAEIEIMDYKIDSLEIAADIKRAEIAPIEQEIAGLNEKFANLGDEYQELWNSYDELFNKPAEEETITIPDAAYDQIWNYKWTFDAAADYFQSLLSYNFDYNFGNQPYSFTWTYPYAVQPSYEDSKIMSIHNPDQKFFIGTILGLPEYVDQYYDGGKKGWNMRENIRNSHSTWCPVNDLILSELQVSQLQEEIAWNKDEQEKAMAEYTKITEMYTSSRDKFLQLAESYGITYNPTTKRYIFNTDNALTTLQNAFEALEEANEAYLNEGTEIPKTVITACFDALRNEQTLKEAMFGENSIWTDGTLTYKDFTMAKWTDGTIGFNKVEEVISGISMNLVIYYGMPTTAYFTNPSDISKASPAEQWYSCSSNLYGIGWLREGLSEEDKDDIQVATTVYGTNINYYYSIEESSELFKKMTEIYGISTPNDAYNAIRHTEWFETFVMETEIDMPTSLIACQDAYKQLSADLTALYNKYCELSTETIASSLEIITKQNEIMTEGMDIMTQITEKEDAIEIIETEADAKDGYQSWSEKSIILASRNALDALSTTLDGIIENTRVTIPAFGTGQDAYPGYTGTADDMETLIEEYEKYIAAIEKGIIKAEDELRAAERNLERFKAGEDDQAYAIEDAEVEVAQAQEEYDYWLEQFNFYNDLLKSLMGKINNNPGA